MKNKEILDYLIEDCDSKGIKDKYIVEYISSSPVTYEKLALEMFNEANMKCLDSVRLYKVIDNETFEIVKEK